ncbi:MAG TPA: response regulator, partial [Sphingomonas sp.]
DVVSRPGEWTRFTLFLPRIDAAAQIDKAGEVVMGAAAYAPGAKTLLLVEDNDGVGRMTVELLAELGFSVVWAATGEAALDILARREGSFDLVFSDIMMPGISGIELATEIRHRWPTLRVVLATGYSEVLADEGGHGFELISKPYTADGLKLRLLSATPPHAAMP